MALFKLERNKPRFICAGIDGVCGTNSQAVHTKTDKLRGLSPRANYTDRATVACR
jgi:hypothetical protein